MTDGNTTGGGRVNRRTFLKRGTAASAAAFGFGPIAGQADDNPVARIDAVLPQIDILANSYLRRLVVFTEEIDEPAPANAAEACFQEDEPSSLVGHQTIVADWEGITRLTADNIQEATDRIVPTRAYLPADTNVSISAPYVIVGGDPCLEGYLRVEAHKLVEAVQGGIGSLDSR